jgi:hypothetical protein
MNKKKKKTECVVRTQLVILLLLPAVTVGTRAARAADLVDAAHALAVEIPLHVLHPAVNGPRVVLW